MTLSEFKQWLDEAVAVLEEERKRRRGGDPVALYGVDEELRGLRRAQDMLREVR